VSRIICKIPCQRWLTLFNLKIIVLRYKIFDQDVERSNEMLTASSAALKSENIRKCLVAGLFPNAAYLHMSGFYRTIRGDLPLAVHPTSTVYTMSPQPAWVIFTEIVHSSKIHIKELTAIEPLWLEVLAPHYYEKVTLRL